MYLFFVQKQASQKLAHFIKFSNFEDFHLFEDRQYLIHFCIFRLERGIYHAQY